MAEISSSTFIPCTKGFCIVWTESGFAGMLYKRGACVVRNWQLSKSGDLIGCMCGYVVLLKNRIYHTSEDLKETRWICFIPVALGYCLFQHIMHLYQYHCCMVQFKKFLCVYSFTEYRNVRTVICAFATWYIFW